MLIFILVQRVNINDYTSDTEMFIFITEQLSYGISFQIFRRMATVHEKDSVRCCIELKSVLNELHNKDENAFEEFYLIQLQTVVYLSRPKA